MATKKRFTKEPIISALKVAGVGIDCMVSISRYSGMFAPRQRPPGRSLHRM